jgi:hypothetical protein
VISASRLPWFCRAAPTTTPLCTAWQADQAGHPMRGVWSAQQKGPQWKSLSEAQSSMHSIARQNACRADQCGSPACQ